METTKRLEAFSTAPMAARNAIGAAVLAVVCLALLHPLRPDLPPPSHMISEYAVGEFGGLMTVSFAAFTLASASVLVLAWSRVQILGRVGLVFLALATIGLSLAVVFPVDPSATSEEAMSFSGRMHGVGFMIGVPGELVGVLLLSIALRPRGRVLPLVAGGMWLSVVLMAYAFASSSIRPGVPPHGWYGIPNRTFMTLYAVWLATAAWKLATSSIPAKSGPAD